MPTRLGQNLLAKSLIADSLTLISALMLFAIAINAHVDSPEIHPDRPALLILSFLFYLPYFLICAFTKKWTSPTKTRLSKVVIAIYYFYVVEISLMALLGIPLIASTKDPPWTHFVLLAACAAFAWAACLCKTICLLRSGGPADDGASGAPLAATRKSAQQA